MGYGRFGVREIADVVFRPLSSIDIGNQHFNKMQPCLYIDTAKTSSLEGAATTVYAQGGKGNPRLLAWEGERTLTLTIEDALLSNISFAMLSGAGVVDAADENDKRIFMHTTYELSVSKETDASGASYYVELDPETRNGDRVVISKEAPIYAVVLNNAGGVKSYLSAVRVSEIQTKAAGSPTWSNLTQLTNGAITSDADTAIRFRIDGPNSSNTSNDGSNYASVQEGDIVRLDCYTVHTSGATQINIDAENFGGYYYIEADTLFRDEETGKDMPASFVIPRGKIQSNFTFSMASSGDPSTFTFTIDCFPGYTAFNRTKKVLAAINVLPADSDDAHSYSNKGISGHQARTNDTDVDEFFGASIYDAGFFAATSSVTSSQASSSSNKRPNFTPTTAG